LSATHTKSISERDSRFITLTILAGISAAVDIAAQYLGPRILVYLFKPLTMILIITIALAGRVHERKDYRRLIVAGLCCSLAGDVFLMLPSDQFIPGLLSFLIAHLFYIAAFKTRPSGLASTLYAAALIAYGSLIFWFLFPHLGEMKLPVTIYLLVILTMAWQALSRWTEKSEPGAAFAAIGAILFVASDSMIAIDRFYDRFRLAEFLILATYFSAQWLIALSVVRERDRA
jgi:uncharacterized membrane protein YhhN